MNKTKGVLTTNHYGQQIINYNTSWYDLTRTERARALDRFIKETNDIDVLTWSKSNIDKYMDYLSLNWDRETGAALAWIPFQLVAETRGGKKND